MVRYKFIGGKSVAIEFNKYYIIILILLISSGLLFWLYSNIKWKINNTKIKFNQNEWIAIICIFITVCIRSYVGMILTFYWKSSFVFAFLSILSVVFGKMF